MLAFLKLEKLDKIKIKIGYAELKVRLIRVIRGFFSKIMSFIPSYYFIVPLSRLRRVIEFTRFARKEINQILIKSNRALLNIIRCEGGGCHPDGYFSPLTGELEGSSFFTFNLSQS